MDPTHSQLHHGELSRDASDDNVDLDEPGYDWSIDLQEQGYDRSFLNSSIEFPQDEPPVIPPAHDADARLLLLPNGSAAHDGHGHAQPQPRRLGWDDFETTIKYLYLDEKKTVKQIVNIMRVQYGFCRSAKAYQNRLKKWQVHKNLNSSEMKLVIEIMNWRKRFEGKDTEFFVRGRPLPPHKIARFVSRNFGDDTAIVDITPGPTPSWLTYHTPRRTFSHGAHGRERSIRASSSATQAASFAPTGSGSQDWYMQSTSTNNDAAAAAVEAPLRSSTANDTRRVLLMLTQQDVNDLAVFYSPVAETDLRRGTDRLHRVLVEDRAGPLCPVSCSYCGFLPGLTDVSVQGVSSLVCSTQQPGLDMRMPSLVALLQFAIKHKEDAVLRHLVLRCQQSKFAQRIHRHLLCVALQFCRGALFRQLLLHGLDVNLDTASSSSSSSVSAGLLEQARMTLRDFTIRHVDLKGDNNTTAEAIGFMYRARVVTDKL